MSFDTVLYARDTQGSLVAIRANPDGALLSALDVSDITVDTDLDSLNGTTIATNTGVAGAGVLRTVHVSDVGHSVDIRQIAGTDVAANAGVAGGGTLRVVEAVDSVVSTSIKSTDVSFETKQVSGFTDSVNLVGATASIYVTGTVTDGLTANDEPALKIGGIARTANPGGRADGQATSATFDKVGRQLHVPYQLRELVKTAYVSLTNGTEATLLAAAGGGQFHDLVEITFANTSTAVVNCDLRDATAGGIVKSFTVPGSSTAGATFSVPIPQNTSNLPWTADMDDVTNTTLNVSATFINNV